MLSPEELQARIAAEFLRVGASQQSWDQNFPTMPSTWVPGSAGTPVLSDESREAYETIARPYLTPVTATPPPPMDCPEPSVMTFIGAPGSNLWACVMPDGALVTPIGEGDEDFGTLPVLPRVEPQPVVRAPTLTGGALPRFVGGRLGRVVFTQQRNRQISGVRFGRLPMVVMPQPPETYAQMYGTHAGAGSAEIQP